MTVDDLSRMLAALKADPLCGTLRGAYADLLDENGLPDRAALHRDLARFAPGPETVPAVGVKMLDLFFAERPRFAGRHRAGRAYRGGVTPLPDGSDASPLDWVAHSRSPCFAYRVPVPVHSAALDDVLCRWYRYDDPFDPGNVSFRVGEFVWFEGSASGCWRLYAAGGSRPLVDWACG